jgi:glycine/D-amino acid oxidase-like deaminating enzyme
VPDATDVAIVGGGYTGLSAARTLARLGADVTLLERDRLGAGASARNGGFVLPGFKPELPDLAARHGADTARALFAMTLSAVNFVERTVAEEGIACDFERPGGVTLAARPSHLEPLAESGRALRQMCGYETELLDAREVRREIGSSEFFGGLIDPGAAALHPARYLQGLATAAGRAGARLIEGTEVTVITGAPGGFVLRTPRGAVRAREILVATDGYTGRWAPALARRVVAVGSYIVATAPLTPALQRQLIPRGRVLSDTRRLLNYFRLSPDGRMVFGGRAGFIPGRLEGSRDLLVAQMRRVFPDLVAVPVEFAWGGRLGFTWDSMPHAGRRDGVHYAVGYCGHGVALSSWLGDRIGAAMAGRGSLPELPESGFRPIPGSRMIDWLLPLVGLYYRMRDAMD